MQVINNIFYNLQLNKFLVTFWQMIIKFVSLTQTTIMDKIPHTINDPKDEILKNSLVLANTGITAPMQNLINHPFFQGEVVVITDIFYLKRKIKFLKRNQNKTN